MKEPLLYAGAQAHGTIEHLGERFRVVRCRAEPARLCKGYALLHGMCPVAETQWTFNGDASAATEYFRLQLNATYPSHGEAPAIQQFMQAKMLCVIAELKARAGYVT